MAVDPKNYTFYAIQDGEDITLNKIKKGMFTVSCYKCKYFTKAERCPAYPGGIPNEFVTGEEKHTKVTAEQKGEIVFTPKQ